MAIAIFMLALVGVFYPYNRGALLSACVVCCLAYCMRASCCEHQQHVNSWVVGQLPCTSYALHMQALLHEVNLKNIGQLYWQSCVGVDGHGNSIAHVHLLCLDGWAMHSMLAPSLLCVQVLYALTAGIAGYVSAVQYKTMGGTNWVCTSLSRSLPCITVNKLDGGLTHLMHFLLDVLSHAAIHVFV